MASSNYPASPEIYPYPTEVKFRDFVPVKLCGSSNYSKWRKLMLRLIKTQELVGFINREVVAPALVDQMVEMPDDATDINKCADSRAWKKSDALLQSWIIGTIHEDLFEIVEDLQTARAMWTTLETVFKDFPTPARNDYPYASEIKMKEFAPTVPIPIKLSRSNYSIWSPMMLTLVEAQGLGGFITGEVSTPPETITVADDRSNTVSGETKKIINQDYRVWKKLDALLRNWILGSINEDLVIEVVNCKIAEQMWAQLWGGVARPLFRDEDVFETETGEAVKQYEPLYRAVVTGDWKSCEEFLKRKPEALTAKVTEESDTPLSLAVASATRNHVVKNLVELMSPEQLAMARDDDQATALEATAMAGNLEAVKLLVKKSPNLPNVYDEDGTPPIWGAAMYGHRDTTAYLLDVTRKDSEFEAFLSRHGAKLVQFLITFGLCDIALPLVKRYKLACKEPSALEAMAARPFAFSTGTRLNWWESFVYTYAPSKFEGSIFSTRHVKQKLVLLFWKVTRILVPQTKQIQKEKLMHSVALELLKHVCGEIAKLDKSRTPKKIMRPLKTAVEVGNYEVVEEILASFPGIMHQ